jgi:hypothetical protein
MYTALLFWLSGILLTLGFNYQLICPEDASFRHKVDVIGGLAVYYVVAWPFFLGADLRAMLEKGK